MTQRRERDRELEQAREAARATLARKLPAHELDDAVSEVMIKVAERLPAGDVRNVAALATKIARDTLADASRRRGHEPQTGDVEVEAVSTGGIDLAQIDGAAAVAAARHELAASLGSWSDDDEARVAALVEWTRNVNADNPIGPVCVSSDPEWWLHAIAAAAAGRPPPAVSVSTDPEVWLRPAEARRPKRGPDWRTIVHALDFGFHRAPAAGKPPRLDRQLTAREIVLAAVAAGVVQLSAAAARKALGGRRRWGALIDVVDDQLERSGLLALRRARAAHGPADPRLEVLPVIGAQHRRRGRSRTRAARKKRP